MLRVDTKQALADAFMELVQTTPIRKIKVADIVRTCGAARGTFYKHFADKYDLIAWVFKTKLATAVENSSEQSWVDILTSLLVCAAEYRALFQALVEDENQHLVYQAYRPVEDYWYRVLRAHLRKDQIPVELMIAVEFTRIGMTGILGEWLAADCLTPPEELAKIIADATPHCLYIRRFAL